MVTKLPKQIQTTSGISNGLRTATVVAVDSGGITLSVNGATLTQKFACLDGTMPMVGDTVSVFRQDSAWLVLGRAALDPSPWTPVTLGSGWSGALSVRPVRGVGYSLQVSGNMTAGTKADGTNVATLPLHPISNRNIPAIVDVTVAGGQSPHFFITTAGVMSCWGCGSAGSVSVEAILPLDL